MNDPRLYVVATPIGNLSDITRRAVEALAAVDAVVCEDTRVTVRLLNHLGIAKPLLALHQHASAQKMNQALAWLEEGKSLALVTDAGTPAISDPGGQFVDQAVRRFGDRLAVIPIPGPCALVAALSVAGFPADSFVFLGFPPHKKGRRAFFEKAAEEKGTVVVYESTHRILKTLGELSASVGDRPLVVCRELTKLHETVYRGSAAQVTAALKSGSLKGEFVIVVGPMVTELRNIRNYGSTKVVETNRNRSVFP